MTPAVTAICRELEGLPLAIELAAARVSQMSAEDLVVGLNQSLHLLTSGSRTAARRQQSLKAAIEWSYDLLTPEERLVFARLSVFVGGFTLGAAEAVCGEGLREVGDLVLGLTDKSMVSTIARRGRSTRYRLLETLRQYAAERLVKAAEEEQTERRHFEFYLDWATSDGQRPFGQKAPSVLDLTEEEIANFRAALGWSLAHEPQGHFRLASALSQLWLTRGSMVEGRAWLEPALAALADRGQTRADALWALGIMAVRQGDAEAARRFNREAIDIYRELGDWAMLARVLNNLAELTSDPAVAQGLLVEGIELARRSQDAVVLGLLLSSRGATLRAEGQAAAARAMFEEGLALRRQAAHEWAIARSLLDLAHLALDEGDRTSARVYLEEALEIVRRLGDDWGLAQVFEAFARSSTDPARMLRLAGSARALRDLTSDLKGTTERPEVEERLRSTRRQLGPKAADIEAAGYAMGLDEAVAEALSEP
jgi:non-specific serine/threonine protein kinase